MNSYLSNFFNLIDTTKLKFLSLLLLSAFVSIMDAIGILSILPLVWVITDFYSFKSLVLEFNINFFNNFFENSISSIIIYLSLFSIFCFSLKIGSSIYIQYILNKFAYEKLFSLRSKILKKIVDLDYITFQKINNNETLNILLTTVHEFIELSLRPFLKIFSEIMIIIILACVLFYTDYKITILILSILTMLFIIYYFAIRKKIYKYGAVSDNENIKTIDSASNNINGFIDLRILNLTNSFYQKFINHISNYSKNKTKSVTLELLPRYLFEFSIFLLLNLIIIFYAFFNNTNFIIQNIALLAVISVRLLPSISIIASSSVALRFSNYHLNKLSNFILNLKNLDTKEIFNKKVLIDPFKKLEIRNLEFSYSNNLIFNKINLNIDKNDFIGLIGSSGSGKSTLIKIICQILLPTKGEIKINNNNIENINFQNKICLISQNYFLINGTIKENITLNYKSQNINEDRILNILKEVNLYDEIIKSGRTIDSKISYDGTELSGGQKQRLIIARSLYFNREFFIFDEAASSLDRENRISLIETLKNLKNKITLIYVTHNLDSLSFCDKVFKINKNGLEKYNN